MQATAISLIRLINCQGDGGAEGSRTPDLVIANDALYQLSYGPPTPPDEGVQARARHKGGGEGVSTGVALPQPGGRACRTGIVGRATRSR